MLTMAQPSISLPDWMDDAVDNRKKEHEPKSHYVRKALLYRFDAEDAGEWVEPESRDENHALADGGSA